MKPADLRAEIERARTEIARLLEYVQALERTLSLLTNKRTNRIVSRVNVQGDNLSGDTKRAAGRATRKHEGQRLLYERDMTVAKLAKELGETRARVSKWFGDADENRPIPRQIATRLLKDYGIPMGVWARIAD